MGPVAIPEQQQGRHRQWACAVLATGATLLATQADAQGSALEVLEACVAPGATYDTTLQKVSAMGWTKVTSPAPTQAEQMAAFGAVANYASEDKPSENSAEILALTSGLIELQRMSASDLEGKKGSSQATGLPDAEQGASFAGEGVDIWIGRVTEINNGQPRRYPDALKMLDPEDGVACTIATAPANDALLAKVRTMRASVDQTDQIVLAGGSFDASDSQAAIVGDYDVYDLPALWRIVGKAPQAPRPSTLLIINSRSIRTNR